MATNPRTSLLLRGKGACKMVYGPPKVEPNEAIRCNFVDARAEMSADGRRLAVVEGDTVRVLDAQSGVELRAQPRPGVQALSISPLGTFIVTWEKLAEGATSGNLRVSSVETGELVAHWMQKVLGDKSAWPAVTWSDDEALCYRLVTNEVHFYDGRRPDTSVPPIHKLRAEGVAKCVLAPAGEPHHLATFVPEKKGAPAMLRVWKYPDFGEGRFVASKAIFKASEVNLCWSPAGRSVLVQTHTEVDKTGKSYYGESALIHMSVTGDVSLVKLPKEGPVHDVRWAPSGEEFIAISGFAPARAALFNKHCKQTHDFGEAARNTVRWAPHGRFFILGGFGNLSGELSFWDRKTLTCLGTVDAHMTVAHEWAPDSRSFLTAILWPRLRVDNGYRIWSPSGKLLHSERIDELTVAAWRPAPPSSFTAPDDSYATPLPKGAAAAAAPVKGKYVPPGARGSAGAPPRAAGGGTSLAALAAAIETSGSAAMASGPPPGSELEDAPSSRNAAKSKAKREAAKKKKAAAEGGAAAETPPPPPPAAAADGEMTLEKLEKKVRAVEKKIRQIAELKELQAGGRELEKNQVEKIGAEEGVRQELAALQLKADELRAADSWR